MYVPMTEYGKYFCDYCTHDREDHGVLMPNCQVLGCECKEYIKAADVVIIPEPEYNSGED